VVPHDDPLPPPSSPPPPDPLRSVYGRQARTIHALATRLGIEPRQEIQPLLDVSFQPRGAHRSTPPGEFFSAEALDIIHQQCADGMSALDYEPVSVSPS
jgi:hypothetical protein